MEKYLVTVKKKTNDMFEIDFKPTLNHSKSDLIACQASLDV